MYSVKKYFVNEIQENNALLENTHFIGKAEKRRSDFVLQIDFPYTKGTYHLFYSGSMRILENACFAIAKILNSENILSERKRGELYKIIIESLHIVHHINTEKSKSKLNGINSLSTSCCDNTFCLARMNNSNSICAHCYSDTQQKTQLALQDRNTINGIILRNIEIPTKYWKKYINPADISKFFRIESFGDVANKTQAINYINFIKAFPRVHFAAWTKNTAIWFFALETCGKPENLSFVVSSDYVNVQRILHINISKYVDHIFTVYDKQFINKNGVNINCGGRSCMDCIKKHCNCYFRGTEKEIAEELK